MWPGTLRDQKCQPARPHRCSESGGARRWGRELALIPQARLAPREGALAPGIGCVLLQMWPGGWGLGQAGASCPAAWMLLLGQPLAGAQGVAGLCWWSGRPAGPWVMALLVECGVGFPQGACCLSLWGAVKQQEVPLMPLPSLGGWRRPSPTRTVSISDEALQTPRR